MGREGGREAWRIGGVVVPWSSAARESRVESRASRKTLLRAPAGRTRTTESLRESRSRSRSRRLADSQCRKMEPAGQGAWPRCMAKVHQAPSGFFLPPMQSLRICHPPHRTRLHTTSKFTRPIWCTTAATKPQRSNWAHALPMPCPCLAHAQFARRAGDIDIRNWPQALAYAMRCILRESMVVCWLTRSLALWHTGIVAVDEIACTDAAPVRRFYTSRGLAQ